MVYRGTNLWLSRLETTRRKPPFTEFTGRYRIPNWRKPPPPLFVFKAGYLQEFKNSAPAHRVGLCGEFAFSVDTEIHELKA